MQFAIQARRRSKEFNEFSPCVRREKKKFRGLSRSVAILDGRTTRREFRGKAGSPD